MEVKLQDIKELLNKKQIPYTYIGGEDIVIKRFSSLQNAKDQSITWIKKVSEENLQLLMDRKGILVVCNETELYKEYPNLNYVFCECPKEAFFSILSVFFKGKELTGISSTAVVETSDIGASCCIGHHSFVGRDVSIGENVHIGHNVTILNKVCIGDGTIIGSGSVIGGEGFGFYKNCEGISEKVPHFGGVTIGKNVEIGSNVCIDRGTLDDTVIGDFVKIDNLCHIAHNVQIGDKCKIIALSLLAGSSKVEESVYIAPGTLVKNQIKIGKNSVVGMGAMILKDVEEGKVVVGAPAKVLRDVTEEDSKL